MRTPGLAEAIINQVKTLQHTSTLYANKPQSDLAEKLHQITPGRLKKSFFTNSGTEADDTAVHAAKTATGRHEIVVLRHSYSGRSATSLSAMGHSTWRPLPAQVAGFVHARAPYCYRCPFKLTYPECGLACANDIEELIMTTTTGEIAAFMAEPILGVGGFIVPPPGYFERAVEITRKHGGLFIADEVQTAWGRTGDKWFGIEHWDVEPDITHFGKGSRQWSAVRYHGRHAGSGRQVPGSDIFNFRRQSGFDGRSARGNPGDRRGRSEAECR